MLLVSQGAGAGAGGGGALSARKCAHQHHMCPLKLTHKKPPLFFYNNATTGHNFISRKRRSFHHHQLTLAKADGSVDSTTSSSATNKKQSLSVNNNNNSSSSSSFNDNNNNNGETVLVGQENVPLEGVIQFDKPSSSSRFDKWGRVALFSGGDVLALVLFSAIGRFSHGYSVFDLDTIRTADPFVAGWFLGAYFLGGYGEDGRGMNGVPKAVMAAIKSWALGIPIGLIIRAVTSGHIPPYTFVLVTMGSTAVLLVGWRALLSSILPTNENKKNDVYRRGSPFELFELLTSLVRRW